MKNIKSLNDLAIKYRDSALNAINPGVPFSGYKTQISKAYRSGELYKQVLKQNSPQTMIQPFGEDGFQIVLNVAPNGAEYGSYVHYGTKKMNKRPFGELALDNPEFKLVLEKVLGEKVGEKVGEYMDNIDDQFKKSGFQVS